MMKSKKTPKDKADLESLNQKIGELTEALQRERADATNLRRRYEEQIAGLRTMIKADIVRELLPIIDNFERSLKHVPDDLTGNDYIKGVSGIVKQFEKTLTDLGVTRIATRGEVFDPKFHDAVSMEEGEGDEEYVTEELQSGYRLGDDVIRHAMVRVATRPASPKAAASDETSPAADAVSGEPSVA